MHNYRCTCALIEIIIRSVAQLLFDQELRKYTLSLHTDRYDILNTSDPIDDAVSWKQLQADLPG